MEEKKPTNIKFIIKSIASLIIMLFLIMSFIVSAYRIPTGSMERTLRVGDMLLVNKFIYGFRTPDWIGIPFTEIGFSIPWAKTPLFKDIKQGDVVVFKHFDLGMDQWVYYVKRCIALPGQTVEIKNKEVYVDGKRFGEFYDTVEIDPMFEEGKAKERFKYPVVFEKEYSKRILKSDEYFKLIKSLPQVRQRLEFYGIVTSKCDVPQNLFSTRTLAKPGDSVEVKNGIVLVNSKEVHFNNSIVIDYIVENVYKLDSLSRDMYNKENNNHFDNFERRKQLSVSDYFFYNTYHMLQELVPRDNYGPITVPEESYFMMGDNRDNSSDSRYWGFAEEKDIVGKPIMVYFSWDSEAPLLKAIRWSRIGYFIQ